LRKNPLNPPEWCVEDDGLFTPEVGDWAEEKYRLLWCYADLFATSMKKKWDERCYMDLFSGSGYARIRGTKRIVQSSPLLALQVTDPFDRYIFCDSDPDCISSLKERVSRLNLQSKCYYKNCDANKSYADIISDLPAYSKEHTVLAFCFIDPFKPNDIKFSTIRHLSTRYVDFLINIPAGEFRRNEDTYTSRSSSIIADYLGIDSWRKTRSKGDPMVPFDLFVADMFDLQMKALKYKFSGLTDYKMVRSTEKNLPLYRLVLYSRHKLGDRFWKDVKKYCDPQRHLFEGL
jgi:three-Cys-motif partner protein